MPKEKACGCEYIKKNTNSTFNRKLKGNLLKNKIPLHGMHKQRVYCNLNHWRLIVAANTFSEICSTS